MRAPRPPARAAEEALAAEAARRRGQTGGVSVTVTWNAFELELPEKSVAVHVTVVVWMRKTEPDAGVQLTFGAASTRSVTVTVKVTFAPLVRLVFTVTSAGTTSVGGVVSFTSTAKLARLVLPPLSVEEHWTVVWPSWNVDPETGAQVTGSVPSTRSVAVTV